MKNYRSWLLIALAWPLMALGQNIGVVSLVEGPLKVIRATSVFMGAEGVPLRSGDIVETADKGLAQLEFDDGTIVALRGASRLLLYVYPSGRRSKSRAPELVLLNGWLKGETKGGDATGAYRYHTPLLTASTSNGTLLVHATAESVDVFLESGSGTVGDIDGGRRSGRMIDGKPGQFFSRVAGKQIVSLSRPPAAFVAAMPVMFQDTLPPRRPALRGKDVDLKTDHDVGYADVADWLKIDKRWRGGFIRQFTPRLRDATFRQALAANLKEHPEWDRILHPEKYRPKTTQSAASEQR